MAIDNTHVYIYIFIYNKYLLRNQLNKLKIEL